MASLAMTMAALQQLPHINTVSMPRKCPAWTRREVGMAAAVAAPRRRRKTVVAFSSPLEGKVEQSIKQAEEVCADNPTSAECAVAWDEVEEVSAEASHQRQKDKEKDPLEAFCKDNPETDECRVYDN